MKDSQQGGGRGRGMSCLAASKARSESDAKEDSWKMRKTVMKREEKQVQTQAGGDG